MGYTPAFDSIYTGTLYGRWPTATVWASLLPLIDKHGEINLSYEAIAGMTGWPMDLLRAGIAELCKPDPGSRTEAEEGRRLVLLDPRRPWGWRVVNHAKYREKARKAAFDAARVADGSNANRMKTRRDPLRPDATRAYPLSDSNTNSDSNKKEKTPRRAARGTPQGAGDVPLHESLPRTDWDEWLEFRRKRRWPVDTTTLRKQLNVLVTFDTETQRQIIAKSINAGWQGIFPPKGRAATKPREALSVQELEIRETQRLSGEGRTATEIASELAMPLDQVQEILRNGHARQ